MKNLLTAITLLLLVASTVVASPNQENIVNLGPYFSNFENLNYPLATLEKENKSIEDNIVLLKTFPFDDLQDDELIQCTVYADFLLTDAGGWSYRYTAIQTGDTCEEAGRRMDLWVSMMDDFGFEPYEL